MENEREEATICRDRLIDIYDELKEIAGIYGRNQFVNKEKVTAVLNDVDALMKDIKEKLG